MRTLLVLFFYALCVATEADEWALLHGIPIEGRDEKTLNLEQAKTLRFNFHANNSVHVRDVLSNATRIPLGLAKSDGFEVTLERNATLAGVPTEKYLQSSFVIDNDEQATRMFISGFDRENVSALSSRSPVVAMEQYVDAYITEPTYIHGFHIASKVAQTRSGDCTEYAVLLVSLARAVGMPARLAKGIAFIQEEGQAVQAFGHAWAEVWLNEKWEIADAALYGVDNKRVFYLPISALDNEGPGYGLSIFSIVGYFPQRISDIEGLK